VDRLRARVLHKQPFCVQCGQRASEVDHVIPRRAGGSDNLENLRALCRRCHASKTAREDGGFGNPT